MAIKSFFFIVLLIILNNNSYSQDSIFFKNKSIMAAKIAEINSNEIKYRRLDNIDGPLFVSAKSEIQSIKFANGQIESFAETIQNTNSNTTSNSSAEDFRSYNGTPNPVVQSQNSANVSNSTPPKIEIRYNNRLVYNNHGLSEGKFYTLIDNFPNKEGKAKLQNEWNSLKKYRTGQMASGFTGLGLGLATPIFGIGYAINNSYSSSDQQTLQTIGASIGGGIIFGVTGAIISTVFKSKRNNKKVEIARMYNEMR